MTAFTASNGIEITPKGDRLALRITLAMGGTLDQLFPAREVTALREYFQHERDQELGRWRDTENPNMVVYPDTDLDEMILVLNETTGQGGYWTRGSGSAPLEDDDREWKRAAYRYFAAHPEPKPWENAEPGEVWALTVAGQDQLYRCGQNGLYGLADGQPLRALTGMFVTGGRRIWPEQEDGE